MSISQQRQIEIFEKHSLPGMALVLNPENVDKIRGIQQKPLIKRCAGADCSRPISNNKRFCKKHADAERATLREKVAATIAKIEDPERRMELISGLPEELRPDPPEGFEWRYDMFTNKVRLSPKLIIVPR